MSQALTTIPSTPISSLITRSSSTTTTTTTTPKPNRISLPQQNAPVDAQIALSPVPRRNIIITLGVVGAVLGFNIGEKNAWAAARRPPPLPPTEKKDPNISGVQAKILASKKRKEAMKQAMTEQRQRGKKIDEPSDLPSPSQPS